MNTRRDKKRLERHHQILDAASTLFSIHGYEQTSIDDIAREADIARGTVFYNFESKEDIVRALRIRSLDDAKERALEFLAEGKPALECIESFLVEVGQWTEKNQELSEVLWRHGPVGSKRFLKSELLDKKITGEKPHGSSGQRPIGPPNFVPIELLQAAQKQRALRADIPAERMSHLFNFIVIHGQFEWLRGNRTQRLHVYMLEELSILLNGLACK